MRGGGLLVFVLLLLAYIYYGPQLVAQLSTKTQEMIASATPVVGPILLVILFVLVIKFYWNRFR
jgi:hypothetical protein